MIPITNRFTYYTISNRQGVKPEYIVMHYFGDLGSAWQTAGWFCNPTNRDGSADFCVDDEMIVQVNPDILKYYTWHCGGPLQGMIRHSYFGKCRNINSIGIEMRPYNDNGRVQAAAHAGWYFHKKTVDNAVELVKYLMKKYDIDADHVIMHADVTGKYCPAPWLDNISQWDVFQASIRGVGGQTMAASDPTPTVETAKKVYRLRKTWEDDKTQKGAYINLENAKSECDKYPGYKVFDSQGRAVYPDDQRDPFKVRVSVNSLRIRKGPGTTYASRGYIKPGVYTIVEQADANGYGWGLLKSYSAKRDGWIALDYTELVR